MLATLKDIDKRLVVGWIAVGISTAITCFWAFWGVIENFHEGWYYESLLHNIGLMLVQYLSPMLVFMGITTVSIRWYWLGIGLHVILALVAVWFFHAFSNPGTFILILPLIGIGGLYWFGRPRPRRLGIYLAIGLPVLTLIVFGAKPVLQVSQRIDDGNLQARMVSGNGVKLTWAPDGPGWPRSGMNWHEAQEACQFLDEQGLHRAPVMQHIWRLPTVGEAVRSMARHGQNSGGIWDADAGKATYEMTPDKESPLWNTHSKVIYWWTATEIDQERAYIIVYDGKVWPRDKRLSPDYLGFRCVK